MLLLLASVSHVAAQISLPNKAYEALSLEVRSLRDNITLYRGDPQQLLLMNVRPDRFRPRVDYVNQADALVRIRDLYVFDHPDFDTKSPEERDKEDNGPVPETWEIRLCPSAPTSFSMQCERGESTFDFTDFEVRKVDISANETKLKVEFSSQNSIELESFNAHVPGGSLQFDHMLNARAKEITLYVPDSACLLEVTGKEFEGDSAINLQGVPTEVQLLVSRKVGLRVTGPAATTAHFRAPHMTHNGEDWVSQNYEAAKCRVRITFGSEVPKLKVGWK
jgi:hypothetical protein